MTQNVHRVTSQTRVIDALALARRHDVSHLPVVSDDRLVGLVCTCDLDDARLDASVGACMHPDVRTIAADAPVARAAAEMEQASVGSLVVVDRGRIVGIVTRDDLAARARGQEPALSRCAACGSFVHLRPGATGEPIWCSECASRRSAPPDEREMGGG
jgi:predicted transcriptional regulator